MLVSFCITVFIIIIFKISVLVGLYEEPEKPNNALEYPLAKFMLFEK